MSAYALEVLNLKKNFVLPLTRKKVTALEDLSFSVKEGGIVGFLGANGAGKTTSIKIILRLIFATSGTVKIFGKDHRDLELKEQIGFLTERPYFYDYLTGREFLSFCAQLFKDRTSSSRIDSLLHEVGLGEAADRPLRRYSKGMLQRVGIAQALINNPKLLILDEPMSGLDPDGRADMAKIIEGVHKRGTTVFFSTHLLPDVENLCDRVIMINKGKLIVESGVIELLDSQSHGFVLELRDKQKDALKKYSFATDGELQKEIAEAQKRGDSVYRVQPARPTLEEVFVKLKREAK